MLGLNADWKDVKTEWKAIIISISVTAMFWYLSFFLFNRTMLLDMPFYIPIIVSFPLSFGVFTLGLGQSILLSLMMGTAKEYKGKVDKILYDGLFYTIAMFSCLIFLNKLYFHWNLAVFSKYLIIINIGSLILIFFLSTTVYSIRYIKKNKKENSSES